MAILILTNVIIFLSLVFKTGSSDNFLPGGEPELRAPSYQIPAVQRFDAGVYECRADSRVGSPAKAELYLQVICKCEQK